MSLKSRIFIFDVVQETRELSILNMLGLCDFFKYIILCYLLAASPLASRGFAPRGIITFSITYPAEKNANVSQIFAIK